MLLSEEPIPHDTHTLYVSCCTGKMMRGANDAHVSKVTHHPHPTEITQPDYHSCATTLFFSGRLNMDTHTHTVSTHAIQQAFACSAALLFLSLSCVHQPDTTRAICLFQPRPSDLSAYGPHLMTSGMPRAVVVVSSVISLYFGLL